MNHKLNSIATTILDLSYVINNEISVQDKNKIYDLIKTEYPSFFVKLTKKKYLTFIIGDKFFFQLDEYNLLCIPKNAKNIQGWLKPKFPNDADLIYAEYTKIKRMFCGSLDISK